MLISLFFFLLSKILSRRQERMADVAGSRNRRANKMARARLRNAENYLRQNLGGAYYEELHKALLGYASDKLMIPAADLSKETVSEKLRESGVRPESIEALISLIDKCEFARYSPDSGLTQMENEYNEAVRVVSEIESQIKNTPRKKASGTAAAILLVLGLGLSAGMASAQDDVSGLWQKGNEAFAAQQWQSALNCYRMIEGENLESADLYYNIGNTYFKMDDLAHAILYYEKALKVNPSHADAANNLDIVRQSTLDRVDSVPEFILVSWFRNLGQGLSADAWAWITVALLLIAGILFTLFRNSASKALSKASFIVACVVVALAIGTFVFSLLQKRALTRQDGAIITAPVCSVKSSPAESGNTVFVLHEGTKVRLLDEVGDWSKVEIADGRQGWAQTRTFEII